MSKPFTYQDLQQKLAAGTIAGMPTNAPLSHGDGAKRAMSEEALQSACITWFAEHYPALWQAKRLWAIPNAAKRGKALAAAMKRTGMVAGVSDLMLSVPRGPWAGMFIELKVGNNSLSAHQEAFIKEHEREYYCVVCWTQESFIEEVKKYLNQ